MKPKIEADHEAQAVYVQLSKTKVKRTVEMGQARVIFDFNERNELVGIELLGVSPARDDESTGSEFLRET